MGEGTTIAYMVGSLDAAKRNPGSVARNPGLRFAASRLQALTVNVLTVFVFENRQKL
jgi:hypothetical protein